MIHSILKAKHWQISAVAVVYAFLTTFLTLWVTEIFGIEPFGKGHFLLDSIWVFVLQVAYPFLITQRLNELLSKQTAYEHRTAVSRNLDYLVVFGVYLTAQFIEGELIKLFLTLIGLISLIRIVSYPAKQLKSIELRRNAGIWEYAFETLQILFWPAGIWWIQPRLNQLETLSIEIAE